MIPRSVSRPAPARKCRCRPSRRPGAAREETMIRWALILVVGVVLGLIVHLVTIMALPRTATHDAYARLTPITAVNTVVPVPPPTPDKALMPFMDPAFAAAVCRYDLSRGPIKFTTPVSL